MLGGAEHQQRRAEQLLPHVTDPGRRPGAGVLLMENDLMAPWQPATASAYRPADADPAILAQPPFPRHPLLDELVLPTWTAAADQRGELAGQVRGKPVAHVSPKGLLVRGLLVRGLHRQAP